MGINFKLLGELINQVFLFLYQILLQGFRLVYPETNFSQIESSSGSCSERDSSRDARNETVVGFDDDTRKLAEQLMGAKRQLQIISIVGMPGLGKTTLARKVYNDPAIVYHFHSRAWTYVTQVPRKRDLLVGILRSGFDYKDEDNEISDEKLSEKLKRRLSGQRYLIVLDDIWDIGAWNDLKWSFPDNKNGSRIIFTSRLAEVPLIAQPQSYQHHLRLLTDEESWNLLQQKVFQKESCPLNLVDIGKQITKKCHGLPLTIVVVAGILANDITPNWWSQVAKDMRNSYDPKQYMDALTLSYDHLPRHLKVCFMYFGVFPEDYEIPVWKLILLWVAEGFVRRTGENNLEDIAEGFLKDLIHKSLVIVVKRRSDGGIKACIVHDLLRDLCLTKAHEENFLQRYTRDMKSLSHLETLFKDGIPRPLCIHSPNSIRVLDLSSMVVMHFPIEILQLEDLRFIALDIWRGSIPASISNLHYLETLIAILREEGGVIPKNIWKMINLRHLVIRRALGLVRGALRGVDFEAAESYEELENLETIKSLNISSKCNDQILERTPNLRKLEISEGLNFQPSKYLKFPNLGKLNRLQKLKLFNSYIPLQRILRLGIPEPGTDYTIPQRIFEPCTFCSSVFFPVTLKKLTLRGTLLEWNEMEKIGMLPNLEVLKLIDMACIGQRWKLSDGGFNRLKCLKLKDLGIRRWNASSEQLPNLRHLKLDRCYRLEEIPLGLGDIYPLEMIEIRDCSPSLEKSAHKLKKDQENKGNDLLKVSISHTGS